MAQAKDAPEFKNINYNIAYAYFKLKQHYTQCRCQTYRHSSSWISSSMLLFDVIVVDAILVVVVVVVGGGGGAVVGVLAAVVVDATITVL